MRAMRPPFHSIFRAPARMALAAVLALLLAACADRDAAQRRGEDGRGRPFRRAAAAEAAGDWDAAVAGYELALRHRPNMAAAHLRLAALYRERRQDVPAALYHYRRALELAPESPDREEINDAIDSCEQYIASTTGGETSALAWESDAIREHAAALQRDLDATRAELARARADLAAAQAAAAARPSPASQPLRAPAAPPKNSPPVSPASPSRATTAAATLPRTHTVRSGDTLAKIAKTYGTTVDAIYQANRGVMRSPNELRVGVTLAIPPTR
jgi:LysM repeat protein